MAKRRKPSTTPEGREDQLIAYAVDLAERQLIEGTASPSVITHFLKLGSTREYLEKEKLLQENALLKAKTESINQRRDIAEIVENALSAMRLYSGYEGSSDDEDLY